MNNLTKRLKRFTALGVVVAMLILQNSGLVMALGLFNAHTRLQRVEAAYASTQITLNNANFENPTSSSYPITPNSWSKMETEALVTAGLINVSQDVYDEKFEDYGLTFNPSKPASAPASENQVLMINAKEHSRRLGYQSNSFVLAKNGYYTVEVFVYTQNYAGIEAAASIYLTGGTKITANDNSKILGINTSGTWQNYKFFVETDSLNDQTVNFELYLGSKLDFTSQGAVFFDQIKIEAHSHDRYYSELDAISAQTNYSILNLKQGKIENAVVNADFEEVVSDPATNNLGWQILTANNSVANSEYAINGIFNIDENFSPALTGVSVEPNNAYRYDNQKALLINNINPASIGFKSSDILIQQHKLYKLSIWAKTGNLTNGANIKLLQQNPYGEDNTTYTPVTASITNIKTSGLTNAKYGNWIEYSFMIKGSVFTDSQVNLELWLGTDTTHEVGHVFFDNIELFEVTTAQYDSISSSDRIKQVNLSTISASPVPNNSTFNNVVIEDLLDTYPHKAKDWTFSSSSANYAFAQTNNGVINTNTAHFNNIKNTTTNYNGFVNPGNLNNIVNDEVSNNVLMLGNVSSTSQRATSTATNLNANSYYLLSFYVQTQNLSDNRVSVMLVHENTPIITLHNLESNLTWTKYSAFIRVGSKTLNPTVQLQLGAQNLEVTGFAFFDNVTIASSTEAAFNAAKTAGAQNTTVINLATENFNAINAQAVNGLYTSLNYTGAQVAGNVEAELIRTGVLDTSTLAFPNQDFPGLVNPLSADETQSNVLMISSLQDTHYTYSSNIQYSLTSGKYYKFSVFVKTFGLSQALDNQKLDDNENTIPFGASVKLSGFDKKFIGIDTQQNQITNEYVEYTFYIRANETQNTNLVLGLGEQDALTSGYAFFSNITLSEISQDAYNTQTALLGGVNPPSTMLNLETSGDPQDDDDNDDDDTAPGINFDFLLFPTLILSIALIIAMIGYSLRQIKFNRLIRKRIKSEIYDRNRTLSIDHERREVVKERQERLAKLKEQLSQIQAQIELNDQEYKLEKQQLAKESAELQKELPKDATAKQAKLAKTQQKQALKSQREAAYQERRAKLIKEFERIEKEIEKLEKEERLMFERYRSYKAQVKAIKQEIKEKQKEARIKQKLKKQKEKLKKK